MIQNETTVFISDEIRQRWRVGEEQSLKKILSCLPENWLSETKANLERKMRFGAKKALKQHLIPYTVENGEWVARSIDWWTNGFWGAEMWQMYLMSNDPFFRDAAIEAEKMMDAALKDFKTLHHDVGFMWLIMSGVRYAIEKNQDSFDRTFLCANLLAGRFNPNGFIRAWNWDSAGLSIIDSMMNLPLLYWASRQTDDPRFKLIAMQHADTAMKYFVREDGSCNHMVTFDPLTGEYVDNPGGQGYASGSSWSRGQSWALYGFTLSYIMTGKEEYLTTAIRVANYFIACTQANDWIPACDFRSPLGGELKDNAAGAVAVCGLMELVKLLPEYQTDAYVQAAVKMLVAMEKNCADWSENQPAVLTMCTGSYHADDHHIAMNYADYYFIEAINKLLGQPMNFWMPDVTVDSDMDESH